MKNRKNTMTDLIPELEKLPQSDLRDQVIAEAKRGEFHDYKNEKYVCGKVALVGYLDALGARELSNAIKNGDYDEEADEQDKEMIRGILASDPRLMKMRDMFGV